MYENYYDNELNMGSPDITCYQVRRGDTLGDIAFRHCVTLNCLLCCNPQIINPNEIYEGQIIYIPPAWSFQRKVTSYEENKTCPDNRNREFPQVCTLSLEPNTNIAPDVGGILWQDIIPGTTLYSKNDYIQIYRDEFKKIKNAIKQLIRTATYHPEKIENALKKEYGKLTSQQKKAIKSIREYKAPIRWALQDLLKQEKIYSHMIAASVSLALKNAKLDPNIAQEVGLILKWYLENFL
jgi:hypothetical protein